MMMIKSVFWWRKPEYPEETTDLRQVTDETLLLGRQPLMFGLYLHHETGGATGTSFLCLLAFQNSRIK